MCDCIEKANHALKPYNTAIDTRLVMNIETGVEREALFIPTRKINSRGKRAMRPFMSYCPMCGVKIEKRDDVSK
jgi:hypothetical protein